MASGGQKDVKWEVLRFRCFCCVPKLGQKVAFSGSLLVNENIYLQKWYWNGYFWLYCLHLLHNILQKNGGCYAGIGIKFSGFFKPKHIHGPLRLWVVTHSCGTSQLSDALIAFTDKKPLRKFSATANHTYLLLIKDSLASRFFWV